MHDVKKVKILFLCIGTWYRSVHGLKMQRQKVLLAVGFEPTHISVLQDPVCTGRDTLECSALDRSAKQA
jgi:hypothetical protein